MKTSLLAFALLTRLVAAELPKDVAEREAIFKSGKCVQWIDDHYNAVACPLGGSEVDALRSEVAQLRADLKAAQITRNADMAACWTTDANAVNARFQAAIAQKEAADLRNAPKPEALAWSGGPQEWLARRGKQIIAMVVQSADGYSLYRQDCETPEKPCELAGLAKSLDEAKARTKGW